MKGRDWLMTQDWSNNEIELALGTANQLKAEFKSGVETLHLPHKSAFLIFFDKSTRTRNSFEAGNSAGTRTSSIPRPRKSRTAKVRRTWVSSCPGTGTAS
jgi:ornithine carbamoyltransferase